MRLERIKPISYLKANAAEIMTDLRETGEPMIITQNGEAKAVIQDIASFEKAQETLALLKILALADRDIKAGRFSPADEVLDRLKTKYSKSDDGA